MMTVVMAAEALRPWLGSSLLAALPDLCAWTAGTLNSWHEGESYAARARLLESGLFLSVRRATGGDMRLRLDSGRVVRVQASDFTVLADELMYYLFRALPGDEYHFLTMRDYALSDGSLSAMRAMFELHRERQPEEEWRTMARVIRGGYPPFRWRGWLEVG